MWRIVTLINKFQSEQKAKQDKIVHCLKRLSLVYRIITLAHNNTNQVISSILLLNHRACDTSQSNSNKYYTMKNVLYQKLWVMDTNPAHVEPPTIPLIE